MSFFKNLFGGSAPKQTALNTNQGLEQLDSQADLLRKRIAHLENQVQEQNNIAKTNASTNKTKALSALKKKKTLEENIKMAQGTLDNIERQKDMLENASTNAAVLKTMAETAKIVKQQHDNLDINKVEDIFDEMRENQEVAEEMAKIISQPVNDVVDDEELKKELELMQQEQMDSKLLETALPDAALPDAPSQLPASSSKNKADEEIDELKKWASMAQ